MLVHICVFARSRASTFNPPVAANAAAHSFAPHRPDPSGVSRGYSADLCVCIPNGILNRMSS